MTSFPTGFTNESTTPMAVLVSRSQTSNAAAASGLDPVAIAMLSVGAVAPFVLLAVVAIVMRCRQSAQRRGNRLDATYAADSNRLDVVDSSKLASSAWNTDGSYKADDGTAGGDHRPPELTEVAVREFFDVHPTSLTPATARLVIPSPGGGNLNGSDGSNSGLSDGRGRQDPEERLIAERPEIHSSAGNNGIAMMSSEVADQVNSSSLPEQYTGDNSAFPDSKNRTQTDDGDRRLSGAGAECDLSRDVDNENNDNDNGSRDSSARNAETSNVTYSSSGNHRRYSSTSDAPLNSSCSTATMDRFNDDEVDYDRRGELPSMSRLHRSEACYDIAATLATKRPSIETTGNGSADDATSTSETRRLSSTSSPHRRSSSTASSAIFFANSNPLPAMGTGDDEIQRVLDCFDEMVNNFDADETEHDVITPTHL